MYSVFKNHLKIKFKQKEFRDLRVDSFDSFEEAFKHLEEYLKDKDNCEIPPENWNGSPFVFSQLGEFVEILPLKNNTKVVKSISLKGRLRFFQDWHNYIYLHQDDEEYCLSDILYEYFEQRDMNFPNLKGKFRITIEKIED